MSPDLAAVSETEAARRAEVARLRAGVERALFWLRKDPAATAVAQAILAAAAGPTDREDHMDGHEPAILEPLGGVSEGPCGRCSGPNPSWTAPSPLWNAVMRGGSIDGPTEFRDFVCPTCFMTLAEQRGVASDWLLDARTINVELETVTPSGRVWDQELMLWVSPLPSEMQAEAARTKRDQCPVCLRVYDHDPTYPVCDGGADNGQDGHEPAVLRPAEARHG